MEIEIESTKEHHGKLVTVAKITECDPEFTLTIETLEECRHGASSRVVTIVYKNGTEIFRKIHGLLNTKQQNHATMISHQQLMTFAFAAI